MLWRPHDYEAGKRDPGAVHHRETEDTEEHRGEGAQTSRILMGSEARQDMEGSRNQLLVWVAMGIGSRDQEFSKWVPDHS